jgi:two-component system response regulator AtoC
LRRAVASLTAQLEAATGERGVIAQSRAMREALEMVGRVADRPTTVLVTGESGTGKEVIARALHRASPRAARPFVAVNCAAIPESLIESELFGHVRGAFTGATTDKSGLFEQADGSTLLLDEIGELPLALQPKLLRALQEGEIRRVGDARTRRVDVRVVAATARDLEAEVRAGRFREDLFYRLNVVTIRLPALRDRPEDIAPLARQFVSQLGHRFGRVLTLAPEATAWLEQQPWPGNVRQLENAIERAAVLSDGGALEPADFAGDRGSGAVGPGEGARTGTLRDAVESAEREAIRAALAAAGGNRRTAASRLGVSLRTLFYKMSRLGLD